MRSCEALLGFGGKNMKFVLSESASAGAHGFARVTE